MFFVNPAAAYVMTRLELKIPRGAWLLQTAAGSALGRMVIRLGRRFGFRTLNVVRRQEQAEELQAIGGDAVLTFDGDCDDPNQLREHVAEITEQQGVAFAIDPVAGKTGSAVVRCLGAKSRMLVYGTLTDDDLSFSPRWLMGPPANIEGFWLSRWMQSQGLVSKLSLVRNITRLIREGVLTSDVGQTFTPEEITAAVRHAEQPARQGKTLLNINDG
jgi:NADPH:quinone reductase-like Zn-dependent oxidoreductase